MKKKELRERARDSERKQESERERERARESERERDALRVGCPGVYGEAYQREK